MAVEDHTQVIEKMLEKDTSKESERPLKRARPDDDQEAISSSQCCHTQDIRLIQTFSERLGSMAQELQSFENQCGLDKSTAQHRVVSIEFQADVIASQHAELMEEFKVLKVDKLAAHHMIASLQIQAKVDAAESARRISDLEKQLREEKKYNESMAEIQKVAWELDNALQRIVVVDEKFLVGDIMGTHFSYVKDALEIIRRACKHMRFAEFYVPNCYEDLEYDKYEGPGHWDLAVRDLEIRLEMRLSTAFVAAFRMVRNTLATSRDKVMVLIRSHPLFCAASDVDQDCIEQEAIHFFDRRLTNQVLRLTSKIWDRDLSKKLLRIGHSDVKGRASMNYGLRNPEKMFELNQQTWIEIGMEETFGS